MCRRHGGERAGMCWGGLWERPMERLLQLALRHFIRAGHLRVTTAGGKSFAVGDGNGTPVAIRFTTRGAQLGVLFDPSSGSAKPTRRGAIDFRLRDYRD